LDHAECAAGFQVKRTAEPHPASTERMVHYDQNSFMQDQMVRSKGDQVAALVGSPISWLLIQYSCVRVVDAVLVARHSEGRDRTERLGGGRHLVLVMGRSPSPIAPVEASAAHAGTTSAAASTTRILLMEVSREPRRCGAFQLYS
jgi:hypothetical protein